MKTLSFLLFVVIFVFAGCSKDDDIPEVKNNELQLKSAENRTYITKDYLNHAEIPLTCDGVEIDWLVGELEYQYIDHYNNGEWDWWIYTAQGEITSTSGETFAIKEIGKVNKSKKGDYLFHSTINGDKGSHLILSGSVVVLSEDPPTYDIVFDKAMCVPDKK